MSSPSNNLLLIGFMGSGKSSIGRLLAKETGRFFLDTDSLIEHSLGMSIPQIFAKKGEEFFREKEVELCEWLQHSVQNAIISTGGGLPLYVQRLFRIGSVLYLECDFESILERMNRNGQSSQRPLFQNPEQAKELFQSRLETYKEQATLTVDGNGSAQSVLKRILPLL